MALFKGKFEKGKQEWETPITLFQILDDEYHFNLDVCADSTNFKCDSYYTIEQDGLHMEWEGTCWMNPPFGSVAKWVKKAYEQGQKDNCKVVCLIGARTNTKWWHDYCMKASEVKFLLGRVKFKGNIHGLPQPLAVVVFDFSEETRFSALDVRRL